jgi:enoyl-CoA hydratase/carnithine racemase
MSEHIIVTQDDAIRIITMRRPEKKNALTQEMYFSIVKAIDSAQDDPSIRCLMIAGSPGAFTAGNDLKDFLAAGSSGEAQGKGSSGGFSLLHALNNNRKPLVAAVDGIAIGIGTTMMFHCDYVVATKTSTFATPFVSLGLVPEGASSLLVPRSIGHQRAFALLVMGRRLDGEAAREAGFVNQIAATGQAEHEAHLVAKEICALPAEAVAISRQLLKLPPETIAERFALEGKHFGERMRSEEALSAFRKFLGKKA